MNPKLQSWLASSQLGNKIYSSIKNPGNKQTYMHDFNKLNLPLLDLTIKKLTMGCADNECKMAEMIMQDLENVNLIEEKDSIVEFLLNLLKAEKTVPVCLYPFDTDIEQWKSIYPDQVIKKARNNEFLLETNLLSSAQKKVFENKLFERIPDEALGTKLRNAEWKLVFTESWPLPMNNPEDFKAFFEKVSGKGPFIILVKTKAEGRDTVAGCFSANPFPTKTDAAISANAVFDIKSTPESLLFYYNDSPNIKFKHFEMKNKGDNLCSIYVDYSLCGGISFANYFLAFSYSYSYSTQIGNMNSLQCVDGTVSYLPYAYNFTDLEIWACDIGELGGAASESEETVTPINKIPANEHIWFNPFNPYQLLR
jgi:hypothetical protein